MASNPSGVATSDLLDLIAATRRKLPAADFVNTFKYADYEPLNYWLRTNSVETSGRGIKTVVRLDTNGTASFVSAYEERELSQKDIAGTMEVDFVHADNYWMISDIESGQNETDAATRIVNLAMMRRAGCFEDICNLVFEKLWAAPDSSNSKLPYGFKHWVVNRASAGAGFDGGNPSGFSTKGGIDASSEDRWKNYAAGGTDYYEDVDKIMVRSMRSAYRKTGFKAPALMKNGVNPRQRYRLYTNDATLNKLAEKSEAQKDGLGYDIASGDGNVTFHRLPFRYVAILDSDSVNPVYGLNMSTWKLRVMKGRNMKELPPMRESDQPDVVVNWVHLSFLLACMNVQANWVVHQ